jgi:diketogulonate reductase-like aldo/keto reductase
MTGRTLSIQGVSAPRFIYGTAWKEDETSRLTELAIQAGFRAIDTANQRKHYCEAAVGHAVAAVIESGVVTRDEVFLQTKFTFPNGQDHRLPYDPRAAVASQVKQSFASSLEHLQVDRIDSYLLHGPSTSSGLSAVDWEAWRAIEILHDSGRARLIGVSNFSLQQLRSLCEQARIRPAFVQNRCYAVRGWDLDIRAFCAQHEIVYQGFSLLTANRDLLNHTFVRDLAGRLNRSAAQILFRFALQAGMLPLTGTTSSSHMQEDLQVFDFSLSNEDVKRIETLAIR